MRSPFSSRLHWDLRPNRLARALEAKRHAGARVLDLTESNPTRAGFDYPAEEILGALADARALVYEPAPAGLQAARETVAGYYAARAVAVEPSRVFLTSSTSESYAWLFKLLADPGDEVLVPRPSYPLFEFLAQMESVRVVQYPLSYHDGWSIDAEALAAALTARTRAIVLVNPNNPTGSFVKRCELELLVAVCGDRGIALISDEVFADYTFGPDAERVSTLTSVDGALTLCLSGLSKIAGLPQMKLGWIVIGGPAAMRADATERLELIADTYLSVGTPVQHALPKLLAAGETVRRQIGARVRENLECLQAAVGDHSPAQVLKVEGGWYATLRVPRTKNEEEWCLDLLDHQDVLVQPGFFYDFESEAFLVLSLLTESETFREGVRRIAGSL
ncbi:MAG TPA: pyridoxal phosphate-dependent aminotransferase [Bryobacteraceae bacterium]|nr:pyridoxal phosphate-dependent aminotransferase [Bryobacteraceae bacterium]